MKIFPLSTFYQKLGPFLKFLIKTLYSLVYRLDFYQTS